MSGVVFNFSNFSHVKLNKDKNLNIIYIKTIFLKLNKKLHLIKVNITKLE